MKKILSIVLVLCLVLGVTACGKKSETKSEVPSNNEMVGIWAVSDIDFSKEALGEYAEGMTDEEIEAELQSYKEIYAAFMGGFYFEFKDDGTCIQGYYSEDTPEEVSEAMKYENGKIIISEATEGEEAYVVDYTIVDEKLNITEDGMTMILEKVNSIEDIKNTELYKKTQEMNSMVDELVEEADAQEVEEDKAD